MGRVAEINYLVVDNLAVNLPLVAKRRVRRVVCETPPEAEVRDGHMQGESCLRERQRQLA